MEDGRGVANCEYKQVEPFGKDDPASFRTCAYLLAAVGSFEGDEKMVRAYAMKATKVHFLRNPAFA
jgi:hypothetical protein